MGEEGFQALLWCAHIRIGSCITNVCVVGVHFVAHVAHYVLAVQQLDAKAQVPSVASLYMRIYVYSVTECMCVLNSNVVPLGSEGFHVTLPRFE